MRAKGKKFKKRYLVIILILLVGDGWLANDKCPAANLSDINRAASDLEQSVLATGKLDALRKVDVGAQVSGQLKTLLVSIGDNVKKISYSA